MAGIRAPAIISKRSAAGCVAAISLLVAAGQAHAATFTATELDYDKALLSQFNLINLSDFNASGSQSIGGRALVGGNATTNGTETVCATATCGNSTLGVASTPSAPIVAATSSSSNNATPANYGYGALTVFGNVSGSVTVVSGGDVDVKGNSSGTSNTYTMNNAGGVNIGGTTAKTSKAVQATEIRLTTSSTLGTISQTSSTTQKSDSAAQVFAPFGSPTSLATNFSTPLKSLYSGLANLPGSPNVKTETLPKLSLNQVFTSGVDYTTTVNGKTYNYGVIQTTLADLQAQNVGRGVANNAADNATFVIVTGSGPATLPTFSYIDSKVIYDFVGATSLTTSGAFNATIIAPYANLIQAATTGTINGTVVVASMTQSAALSSNAFTGDLTGLANFNYNSRVPEPASMALLGAGLAVVAMVRLRNV